MLNEEQEENLHGFTGDIKEFLRKDDFTSALILVDDLKRYIKEIRKSKRLLNK